MGGDLGAESECSRVEVAPHALSCCFVSFTGLGGVLRRPFGRYANGSVRAIDSPTVAARIRLDGNLGLSAGSALFREGRPSPRKRHETTTKRRRALTVERAINLGRIKATKTHERAQLGHATPTTTLRYYARWIPSQGRRWVEVLDRATWAPDAEVGTRIWEPRRAERGTSTASGRIDW